ncbi:hypothetical protein SAMN02799624_05218 [Paenibacillus sp. UNC496MF]|uniref:hypothetical protein n=1 Tax=Paenibacillus sp. UNC496MF TaxID=1502753 RepID=UPI0008E51736|nr:hypothetical protein [Paenibacillus sp. UNC496MF]SFJ62290.1 hypothetical protein SAMN02799624_05218 [Paenibacillus sp. UNC496MF]
MLESRLSIAVSATPQAVPFPVDFKDVSEDRLFRQVTFPGTTGTYRLRAEGQGLRIASSVIQRSVDTGIAMVDVDGKLFRIKAVLTEPVQGITESYWLTLHHDDYADVVQDHNQYRVRGVSENGWKTDWVYSELKDRDNRLEVFQLLHDVLDLVAMVHDDELEAFLTTLVEDTFHAILFQEGTPLYSIGFDSLESLTAYLQENLDMNSSALPGIDENFVSRVESAIRYVSTMLGQSLKESFSAGLNEDSQLIKMYREMDTFTQNPADFVGLLMEHYLADAIEKVVTAANIEVFLDNGENKQLYLEGRYNFDIKGELLRVSYDLMPEDRFFLNASSTVKLLTEPAFQEDLGVKMLDSTRETLTMFRELVQEVVDLSPGEEIMKYLRLLMKDLYLPHAIVDRRFAEVSVDLEDAKGPISQDDAVVQFDLETNGATIKSMFLKDMARAMIIGELKLETDFEAALLDELMRIMTDSVDFRTFHDVFEYFDGLALIGEQFATHYKMMSAERQEALDVTALDLSWLSLGLLKGAADSLSIQSCDVTRLQPDLANALFNHLDVQLGDTFAVAPSLRSLARDEQSMDMTDEAAARSDLSQQLHEYFGLAAGELADRRFDLAPGLQDSLQVAFSRLVNPTYLPHPKDDYGRDKGESKDVLIEPNLNDSFELNGKERVLYALGDVSETGSPIGKFKIGTNTLKGVNP